jgi:hypothetical protein
MWALVTTHAIALDATGDWTLESGHLAFPLVDLLSALVLLRLGNLRLEVAEAGIE